MGGLWHIFTLFPTATAVSSRLQAAEEEVVDLSHELPVHLVHPGPVQLGQRILAALQGDVAAIPLGEGPLLGAEFFQVGHGFQGAEDVVMAGAAFFIQRQETYLGIG